MAFMDAFGGFTFAPFNMENIPVAVAVMIDLSVIKFSVLFFQSKIAVYCIFFKSIWRHFDGSSFFIGEEFFRLKSVICKKYTNTNGKDRKHANSIDINII